MQYVSISSLTRMITTPLLQGALRFARKPSLLMAGGKGVTRRSNGEMTVLHQLKILPGQSKEPLRICQRWGERRACDVYKQMPQRPLECIQIIVGDFLHLQGLILLLRCTNIVAFLTGYLKECKSKSHR